MVGAAARGTVAAMAHLRTLSFLLVSLAAACTVHTQPAGPMGPPPGPTPGPVVASPTPTPAPAPPPAPPPDRYPITMPGWVEGID